MSYQMINALDIGIMDKLFSVVLIILINLKQMMMYF